MTAPNSEAVQSCIRGAIQDAGISAAEIDAINGHLTATDKRRSRNRKLDHGFTKEWGRFSLY